VLFSGHRKFSSLKIESGYRGRYLSMKSFSVLPSPQEVSVVNDDGGLFWRGAWLKLAAVALAKFILAPETDMVVVAAPQPEPDEADADAAAAAAAARLSQTLGVEKGEYSVGLAVEERAVEESPFGLVTVG